MADNPPAKEPTCATCKKPASSLPEPLKRCARCKEASYCSRECQKEDWKAHKKTCGQWEDVDDQPPEQDAHNPGFHTMNNLMGLSGNDHLHKLGEKDAMIQLIDCFRMRVEDEYVFAGNTMSIYNREDPRRDFIKFLNLAEKRSGLLPAWWNKEKREECMRLATTGEWSNIKYAVEKPDIQEHYHDPTMPMKLRILGEKVYGKGFM